MRRISSLISGSVFILLVLGFTRCSTPELPVSGYYDYDQELPLLDSVRLLADSSGYSLYYFTYHSIHDRKVTGLLSIPENTNRPVPVIILLHGLGDSKTVDYIETGNKYLIDAGYAVLRIDICNHGDRYKYDYDFDLIHGYKYWTRDIVAQTVFDLRRAVDFIGTRTDLDHDRIGFYGISLGGIIGTVFCGVEKRVKVPVIVLAGGNLNLMFGTKALSKETKVFLSFIDPINFVVSVSPRPLLMINAENDEIVPPVTTKLLYKKAKNPKKIIWYPAKHHTLPVDKAYPDGIRWFDEYLK
ncbi:MAG: alpha/beta hydrolase [Chlorobi bacterium]|nr:alpha/beta hydrolase [Chlorobiota bacterium]